MGFDLYGISPKENTIKPKILKQEFSDLNKDQYEDYFAASNEYQSKNPGSYFRANVWYWRPIWSFVCGACEDFLTKTDMKKGGLNDGALISKTKANKIAQRLKNLDKQGIIDTYKEEMDDVVSKATEKNKALEEIKKEISKKVEEKFGELVPNEYPEPYKKQWLEAQKAEDWSANYPFSKNVLMKFVNFCEQSGGFEIC
jgi:hypothetical protein